MEIIASPKKAKLHKKAKWQPKKWDPLYDQMVALSCTGLSNKAIADRFGYTPQQVCNILTSEQAKIIKSLVTRHIQEESLKSTTERLSRAEQRSVAIIENVLNNEEILAKHPVAMYDRALAFLKGRGQLLEDEKKVALTREIFVPVELLDKLVSGISKANEAALLHKGAEIRTLSSGVPHGPEDARSKRTA